MRVEHKEEQKKPEQFVPDQPMGKVIFLAAATVASAALFWLAWHNALTSVEWSLGAKNIITIISTLLAFCLMFTVSALTELLVTKKLIPLVMVVLAGASAFIFFPVTLWTIVGALVVMLAFLYWRREIRIDLKSRTSFVPQKSINNGLRGAVTLILLASSLMYYGYLVNDTNTNETLIDGLVDSGMGAVNIGLDTFYGDSYDPDMTLDAFVANLTRIGDLKEEGIDEIEAITPEIEELDALIKEGIESAETEIVAQARDEFLSTFGIEAAGDERMESVVRKIATKNINNFVEPYQQFLPVLLAVSLFFLMNIFGFLYRELIKSFTYLLYLILKWTHFIKIKKIQVEAERVTL